MPLVGTHWAEFSGPRVVRFDLLSFD